MQSSMRAFAQSIPKFDKIIVVQSISDLSFELSCIELDIMEPGYKLATSTFR